jgi:putative heme-binding domain-containing protein
MPRLRVVILVLFSMAPSRPGLARDGGLESQLRAEDPSYLVRASRLQGDARRGAILFHRPSSGCIICHSVAGHGGHVGPDLARPRPDLDPQGAIEAILNPSKSIAPGFETMILSLTDGRVLSALLVDDRPDRLVLRDAARPDPLIEVAKDTIEERRASELSAMPEGLVNTLADRQSFLDLARYVIEITEGGAPRARLLEPDQAALAPPPLPDYEHTLDHARLISGWGPDSLRRGEEIYARVCANCHGTPERPGSLPSSLRFWSDRFRNGSDPYRMYQTLTLGFDQMAAQSWMTPRAKYDVIHYIRETYLSSRNPDQFTVADGAYLATLPKGNALGPDSPSPTPWKDMNYSPVFAGSIEVGSDRSNIAYKGLALRLDDGPGGVARGRAWALYELDTLRVAGFWTGEDFIDWESIQLNGRHEVHPHTVGDVVLANPNLPGWKHPTEPMREDARLKGRDGVRYGPLPRDWVQLLGRYQHGNDTILAYAVGQTRILERPGIAKNPARPEVPIFTRTFEIDARSSELVARLGPATVSYSLSTCNGARIQLENDFAFLHIASSKATRHVTVFMTAMPQGELDSWAHTAPQTQALESFTHGAPPLWPEPVLVAAAAVSTEGPFHVADLSLPSANPWKALVRPTGFDFLDEGKKAAVCTWDGDVWLVDLVDQITGALTWRRIATGLYQPLGPPRSRRRHPRFVPRSDRRPA